MACWSARRSADLQGDDLPAVIAAGPPACDSSIRAAMARTRCRGCRSRTPRRRWVLRRRPCAAAPGAASPHRRVGGRARQRDDRVDQRGRHQRPQLRDGPAPVHDLQHPAQRRVGEDGSRARRRWSRPPGAGHRSQPLAVRRCSVAGAAAGTEPLGRRLGMEPLGRRHSAGRWAGDSGMEHPSGVSMSRSSGSGGGSQSMIGDVNDTGSGGMRDAVMVLSSGRRNGDGICWRVADTFMIARFDEADAPVMRDTEPAG